MRLGQRPGEQGHVGQGSSCRPGVGSGDSVSVKGHSNDEEASTWPVVTDSDRQGHVGSLPHSGAPRGCSECLLGLPSKR